MKYFKMSVRIDILKYFIFFYFSHSGRDRCLQYHIILSSYFFARARVFGIRKLPTCNISNGYQKQRKKDTSPRRKVSKVNL